MKKILFFAAAAALFAACSKDATEDVAVLPDNVLYVSVADDDSRIQLDENCRTVWNEGDLVSVFNKTTGNECWRFDGKTGDTVGTLSKVSGDAGASTDKVVALYPYSPNCTVSGNMISTAIPATQTYRADSFGDGGNIMLAVSDNNDMKFNHIFGWIRLSLTDELERTIRSIELTGNSNEKLAGDVIIDANTQNVYMVGNNASSITLDCDEGVQLSKTAPTYFYIAVVPQTFTNGIKITAHYTGGSAFEKSTKNRISVTRNHIIPMNNAETGESDRIVIKYVSSNKRIIDNSSQNSKWWSEVISNTYDAENNVGTLVLPKDSSIGDNAFKNITWLVSIDIPDNMKGAICEHAFDGCIALKSIRMSANTSNIGSYAFNNCKSLVADIVIPNGQETIYTHTFYGCMKLISITIPDSVTRIRENTFTNCSIQGLYITDIAKWCEIIFVSPGSNPLSHAHNLYLNNEQVTDLVIPDGVTKITDGAFAGCSSLTSVTIPDSVTNIAFDVFAGCSNLASVTIPGSLAVISDSTFYNCSSLTKVNISDGVISIGDKAFSNCTSLTNITIPDSVVEIDACAFEYCSNLTSIKISNNATSIGLMAFYNCYNLTNINIPDSVTSIGSSAFMYCKSLTSVTISDSITSIEENTFCNCISLTSINIPDGVTSIEKEAFSFCRKLTSITIPDSVTYIGKSAFEYCYGLSKIYCKPTIPPTLGSNAFDNIKTISDPLAKIYVPMTSVNAYKNSVWYNYALEFIGYNF